MEAGSLSAVTSHSLSTTKRLRAVVMEAIRDRLAGVGAAAADGPAALEDGSAADESAALEVDGPGAFAGRLVGTA